MNIDTYNNRKHTEYRDNNGDIENTCYSNIHCSYMQYRYKITENTKEQLHTYVRSYVHKINIKNPIKIEYASQFLLLRTVTVAPMI